VFLAFGSFGLSTGHVTSLAAEQRPLAQFDIHLLGLSASVQSPTPVVPKNITSGVRIVVRSGDRELSLAEATQILGGGLQARAELSGPGLGQPLQLPLPDQTSSDPLLLPIPALAVAGDYTLTNIRLVAGGRTVLDVSPRTVTVEVIDQILVTSVQTRPLTLDEIRERGIHLTGNDYLAFEFTLGLLQDSRVVNFSMPVVFDRRGVPVPLPIQPPAIPPRATVEVPAGPLPTIVPLLLEPPEDLTLPEGPNEPIRLPSGEPLRVPAVLVIPGNVGYLKQFFSAQLFVANGAPAGSGLTLRNVTGTIHLPPGADNAPDTADDPLALPLIDRNGQTITQPATMSVRTAGNDGVPGTPDDGEVLAPTVQGQAEFLLRGEREGFHTIDFDISAVLDGLAIGPVTLTGRAAGGVLVRNPFFNLSFTVPAVTRRGEPFKVFATVTNVGQGVANDVRVSLDPSRLSGAVLTGESSLQIDTLRTGDSRTLVFDFRAQRTGQVVASYLHFEPGSGATGDLRFALGVDERGVALSPDTLVLPTSIDGLPSDIVEAGMRVLGQAWSLANAPAGTLPPGVLRVTKTVVTRKALALAEAGLRVTLGESVTDALRNLVFDFYGGDAVDPAFDQLLRQTEAGHDLARLAGAALAPASVAAGGAIAYEQAVADIAASGPRFFTFGIASGGGGPPVDVTLIDAAGRQTVQESGALPIPTSNVVGAVMLPLGSPGAAPILGLVASPNAGPYVLELTGRTAGAYDLVITVPRGDAAFAHASIAGTASPASRSRLLIDAVDASSLTLQEDANGDGVFETSRAIPLTTLSPSGPRLLSATVVGPETFESASPFGFQTVFLFDRFVDADAASRVDRYAIPRNGVQNASRQLSGRMVFGSLQQPEASYIATTVTAAAMPDTHGVVGPAATVPLRSRLVDLGAVVTGRVFHADGTPVTSGVVVYENNLLWTCPVNQLGELRSEITGFAAVPLSGDGSFEFRYVRQDTCGLPWRMATSDPQSGARRSVSGYVRAAGEHIVLDIALLGRGTVTGTVRNLTGAPVPGARVVAISQTDTQEGGAGTTDGAGRYVIPGITVGQLSVSAVRGNSAGASSGRLDRAGTTTTIDVTLDGGTVQVSGRVLLDEDGTVSPVAGVPVVFSLASSGALAVAATRPDGSYTFEGMPVGSFVISAALDASRQAAIQGVGASGDRQTGLDLVIVAPDPNTGSGNGFGTVRGVVRLPSGSPASGIVVSIGSRGVLSGADGAFEVRGVPVRPGIDQMVTARSRDGLRSGVAVARVNQSGQVVEGVAIALSGVGSVVFTVLDPAGLPLAGQPVALTSFCDAACGCAPRTTGSDGVVRFDGLPIGPIGAKAVRPTVGFTDVANASATIAREGDVVNATIRFLGAGFVTGTVRDPDGRPALGATVDLHSRAFDAAVCDVTNSHSQSARTGASGIYQFTGVGVGSVHVTASHPFFPTPAGRGGILTQHGQQLTLDLVLANGTSTISGELSGTVFLPDGVTPAGAGVELTMNGVLPDVVVTTDVQGHFRFAEIFPEGSYTLTVRDSITGGVAQEMLYLRAAQDAVHDVRLKGTGTVRVRVVNGADEPVDAALVRLRETAFPGRLFEAVLDPSTLGLVTFEAVFEGPISVEASDAFARGGRAASTLPRSGDTIDIKVVLTTTGTVRGRFFLSDRTTPIPYATVALVSGGRTIGQTTTAGSGDVGAFEFAFVPAGPVQISAQDPASARTGLAGGTIQTDGQILTLDVIAQSLGTVEGLVTSNGAPQPGANVALAAGSLDTNTLSDVDGRYRVTGVPEGRVVVTASLGDGFLAGTAAATLLGEGTLLPLDVALRASGRVEGSVLDADGVTPAPASVVFIQVGGPGGGSFSTTTNEDGRFTFDRVPAGLATLTVDVLGSIDRAAATADVPAGATVTVTISLNGVGRVTGHTLDAAGQPVEGDVRITAGGASGYHATFHTDADGAFVFPEVPAGAFTLSLTVGSGTFPLHGTASGTVAPRGTASLNVQVQPSGSVTGLVLRSDGATPAFGAAITVALDAGRGAVALYSQSDGRFQADGIPLGAFDVRIRDQFTAGVALVQGRELTANGQVLNVGNVVLDDSDPVVVSVSPEDGSVDVPVDQVIELRFSDPLQSAAGVSVRSGTTTLPLVASLSSDRLTVTLTGALPADSQIEVLVSTAVTDVHGRHPTQSSVSRFHTRLISTPPILSIAKSHVGNFPQGQSGLYSIIVSNVGGAPTNGLVTVSDTLPSGLTLASMAGSGWQCSAATCTRSDALAPGASYPTITVAVNVATDATSPQVNAVSVSGGGSAGASASDPTGISTSNLVTNGTFDGNADGWELVGACRGTGWVGTGNPPGSLQIEACGDPGSDPTARQTLNGLTPGQRYLVSVDVHVHDLVSPTATSFGIFLDAQPANPIALAGFFDSAWHTVTASFAATSSTHTLIFGSELDTRTPGAVGNSDVSYYIDNVTASATIGAMPALSIVKSHAGNFTQGQPGLYMIVVSNAAGAGATSGTVTVTETLPSGLSLTSMTGVGWQCASNVCTRNDGLAPGSSYPAISVSVGVASSAASPVVNTAAVSGGGSATATAVDSTVIVPAPTACVPMPSGVRGWWPGNGSALDAAYAHDGAFIGAAAFSDGVVGQAFSFNGLNSYVEVPPFSGLELADALTVEAWINMRTANRLQYVLIKDFGTGDGRFHNYQLAIGSDNSVVFWLGDGVSLYSATSSAQLSPNIWHHVAAVYNGTQMLIYVNGVLSGSATIGSHTLFASGEAPLRIGAARELGSVGAVFDGAIDDVRVFDRALSASEIGAIVAAGSVGVCEFNPPQLGLFTRRSGPFTQGQRGVYTIEVFNESGATTTNGTVTVTQQLPPGLVHVLSAGSGWQCAGATCTRSDAAPGGRIYPLITVTVDVLPDATSPQVNVVTVSGGGSASASFTDPITILAATTLLQLEPLRIRQTVTFDVPLDLTLGGPPLVAPARASSGLPVTLTATGSCVVGGSAVIAVLEGECTLTATRPGDAFYEPAEAVVQTIRVQPRRILPAGTITAIVQDPLVPGLLYAGAAGGVFRSEDGGLHWQHAGALFQFVHAMAIEPGEGGRVYAATPNGVFSSRDRGEHWTALPSPFTCSSAILTASGRPSALYVGGCDGRVHRTSDGGEWTTSDPLPGHGSVTALASRLGSPDVVHAGFDAGGLARSNDGGRTWVIVGGQLAGVTVRSIAIDLSDPRRMYIGSPTGVHKSTNGGDTWTSIGPASPVAVSIGDVRLDPHASNVVYAASLEPGGVFRSADAGATWTPLTAGLPTSMRRGVRLAFEAGKSGQVYLATAGHGVFRSDDDGLSWFPVSAGLTAARVGALAAADEVLYAGTAGAGVFRSDDGGSTWRASNDGLTGGRIEALAVDPFVTSTLYAGDAAQGVMQSATAGRTWTSVFRDAFSPIAVDPSTYGVAYAGAPGAVFRTTDGGRTWTAMNSPSPSAPASALVVDPANAATVYGAWSCEGLYRSADSGRSWVHLVSGLEGACIESLAITASTPTTLYAGTRDGVFRSVDGGQQWVRVANTSGPVLALVVDRTRPGVAYSGGAGLFRTVDGGDSWSAIGEGISVTIRSIVVDSSDPNVIVVGTDGGGVFKSTDAGATWRQVGAQ
jgi:uncharacterized repeat protein (TIGR01451 family)